MTNQILEALQAAGLNAYEAAHTEPLSYPCALVWDAGLRTTTKTTGEREFIIAAKAATETEALCVAAEVRKALQALRTLRETDKERHFHIDKLTNTVSYELHFRMLCGR